MEKIEISGSTGYGDGITSSGYGGGPSSGCSGSSGRTVTKEELKLLTENKWYRFKYNFKDFIGSIKLAIEYWTWDWNNLQWVWDMVGGNFIYLILNKNHFYYMNEKELLD